MPENSINSKTDIFGPTKNEIDSIQEDLQLEDTGFYKIRRTPDRLSPRKTFQSDEHSEPKGKRYRSSKSTHEKKNSKTNFVETEKVINNVSKLAEKTEKVLPLTFLIKNNKITSPVVDSGKNEDNSELKVSQKEKNKKNLTETQEKYKNSIPVDNCDKKIKILEQSTTTMKDGHSEDDLKCNGLFDSSVIIPETKPKRKLMTRPKNLKKILKLKDKKIVGNKHSFLFDSSIAVLKLNKMIKEDDEIFSEIGNIEQSTNRKVVSPFIVCRKNNSDVSQKKEFDGKESSRLSQKEENVKKTFITKRNKKSATQKKNSPMMKKDDLKEITAASSEKQLENSKKEVDLEINTPSKKRTSFSRKPIESKVDQNEDKSQTVIQKPIVESEIKTPLKKTQRKTGNPTTPKRRRTTTSKVENPDSLLESSTIDISKDKLSSLVDTKTTTRAHDTIKSVNVDSEMRESVKDSQISPKIDISGQINNKDDTHDMIKNVKTVDEISRSEICDKNGDSLFDAEKDVSPKKTKGKSLPAVVKRNVSTMPNLAPEIVPESEQITKADNKKISILQNNSKKNIIKSKKGRKLINKTKPGRQKKTADKPSSSRRGRPKKENINHLSENDVIEFNQRHPVETKRRFSLTEFTIIEMEKQEERLDHIAALSLIKLSQEKVEVRQSPDPQPRENIKKRVNYFSNRLNKSRSKRAKLKELLLIEQEKNKKLSDQKNHLEASIENCQKMVSESNQHVNHLTEKIIELNNEYSIREIDLQKIRIGIESASKLKEMCFKEANNYKKMISQLKLENEELRKNNESLKITVKELISEKNSGG
ncbi:hypothetical protein M153_2500020141 [Pseudoloma neurophilia]|uniref:Uncharacterized protein n=1 Tax=Pseudoloma neurophilia TaxID=146866 RepID=A0A0R0M0M2_9MICR|nr:hypothetical protein M153_2500020141 [Pseudoloma neurophilia]